LYAYLKPNALVNGSTETVNIFFTDDLNWDKDIVNEIGSLAKEAIG
jgi:hypothetical protein